MRRLALVIPELLPVTPDLGKEGFPVPVTPCLARILARGNVSTDPSASDRERLLLKFFGVELSAPESPPLAAIMRVAEGGEPDQCWWLRLDAVHLQADIDKLVLQLPGALALGTEANRAFGALLRQVLDCEDADLEPAASGGWYLRLAGDPEIATLPPAAGRAMARLDILPVGAGAARWHKTITEAQMLLHQLQENPDTESCALQGINSVWVWGAGRCPDQILAPVQLVFGDGELLRGLGRMAGVEVKAVPADFDALLRGATTVETGLVVIEPPDQAWAAHDPWAWQLWLQRLESEWFLPLWRALARGQVGELSICPGMGAEFHITRQALVRFWRRPHPISDWGLRLARKLHGDAQIPTI